MIGRVGWILRILSLKAKQLEAQLKNGVAYKKKTCTQNKILFTELKKYFFFQYILVWNFGYTRVWPGVFTFRGNFQKITFFLSSPGIFELETQKLAEI